VLFSDGTTSKTIQKLLNESPLAVDGEFELFGMRYPIIRSQPVPHPFNWNDRPVFVELYSIRLIDFGHGHSIFILQSI
jgi:serine/threonine-protein kinase SRPK3